MNSVQDMSLIDLATIISGFGTAIAALVAVIGVVIAIIQVRSYRSVQSENMAKSLFRDYLKEALERPDLLSPDHEKLAGAGRMVEYELFVAHMLYSLDAVLANTHSTEWREVARGELARHMVFLNSDEFQKQRQYYSVELIQIIDEIRASST